MNFVKSLFATVIVAFASPVLAFDVQPTINVIQLPADARGIAVQVRNPRNVALPISVEIVERKVNADGTEEQTPADDLFLVFPPQSTIPAGQTQTLRLQWVGEPPQQSRSFTLYAAEVPVDLTNSGTSGVQRILRIGASVHVTPVTAKAKPVVRGAEPAPGGTKVTIANEGDRFIYVNSLSLTFDGKTVEGEKLAEVAGRTLIPPGAHRDFVVPDVTGTPTLKTLN